MRRGDIIQKIEQRLEELEEIAPGVDWEQWIYEDEEYVIILCRDYYDERGFYIIIDKEGENAAVSLRELPETVLGETLEILRDVNLEEAIIDTQGGE